MIATWIQRLLRLIHRKHSDAHAVMDTLILAEALTYGHAYRPWLLRGESDSLIDLHDHTAESRRKGTA